MTIAVCPGSYDPPHHGHIDILNRSAKLFDEVVVAVITNPSKAPTFSPAERVDMLKALVSENVRVEISDGLTVDVAKAVGATAIVKGIRNSTDYEYELQMALMNRHLTGIETVFVPSDANLGHISSSLIKEIAKLGGSIEGLVPDAVAALLEERING